MPLRTGADEGNRTPISSLGSSRSAIELHPRAEASIPTDLGGAGLTTGITPLARRMQPEGAWTPCSTLRADAGDGAVILSDRSIREQIEAGRIVIEPFDPRRVQPSSVDLHVDRVFRTFHNARYPFIDVKRPMEGLTELVEVRDGETFILHPGEFVLGSTLERIALPDDLVARLEGKSSLGRLGLLIHSTAGYVDPGWDGFLTL